MSEVVVEREKSDIDVEVLMMKRRILILTFLIHNQVQHLFHRFEWLSILEVVHKIA